MTVIRRFRVGADTYVHDMDFSTDNVYLKNEDSETLLTFTPDCQVLDADGLQIGCFSMAGETRDWMFYPEVGARIDGSAHTGPEAVLDFEVDISKKYILDHESRHLWEQRV